MRKNNKKGFTIVELVIVIAVIAILAAVLIPTFASMINKANESKALQEAKNAYTADLALLDGQATNYSKDEYYTYKITSDTTFASDKNYYTKSGEKYVKAEVTANETVTAGIYYEKDTSICSGVFSGTDYTTYTYEAEGSEYKCTYTNGSWDVEKKN